MRRRFLLALIALPTGPAIAQDRPRGAAPPPAQQQPAITLQLLPDTVQGHRARPLSGNAFPENQRELLFNVVMGRSAARQQFQVRFLGVTTTYSNGFNITQVAGAADTDGTLQLTLSNRRDWPVGEYALVVSHEGREVATLSYFIQPTTPRNTSLTVQAIQVARQGPNGQAEPAPRVRPQDRELTFSATVQGSRTDGAAIAWRLQAVDTTGGSGLILERELPRQYIENSELSFDVEIRRDWWIGRYRVELAVDGQIAAVKDFDVTE